MLSQAIHIDQSSIVNITSALTSATTMANNKNMYAGDLNAATSTLGTVASVVSKTTVDNDGLSNIAEVFQLFALIRPSKQVLILIKYAYGW